MKEYFMTKSDDKTKTELQLFPKFNLMVAHSDKEISRTEKKLQAQKFIVYTYPKDLTSGCTKEANEFSTNFDFFTANGFSIYGLSKDSIKSHLKFIDKEKIPFPLISDPDCILIKALGCWVKKSMYGKEYMGISRSTFLVNRGLEIKKIWWNVKVKDHVSNVMAEILN